jgi:glycosyltransferase involved in cell wall biosynthesis
MKILYLTQLYSPVLYGGGEYIFAKWAEEFARRGDEVSVITQKIAGARSFERLNGVNVHRIKPEIDYNGALYNIGIRQNLGFLVNAIRRAGKLVHEYDVLHSNTFIPTLAAETVARISRQPHLATIHDVYIQADKSFWKKWSTQKELGYFTKFAGNFIEKLILNLPFKMVHTVSHTSKTDLVKAGIPASKIWVIPNGISPDEYKSTSAKKTLQIAYVGRLVFYKNLDTVIKAFRRVCDWKPGATFIIAGSGPYEQKLKDLTVELGLQKNVWFAGQITDKEKVDLLSESQLMIQPSLIEGFGITVIESFCCNTPVLSSNVMPLPELVLDRKNGLTLPPFDSEAWAKAILDYLDNPEKCLQQGIAGFKLVEEKYTLVHAVDRLKELYQQLINEF